MKRIAPLFLLLALVGTVIAKTMTSGDSSSLAKANQLLLDVAKAYQEAPALTDDISIDISEQRGDTSLTLELALAGKREGFFSYGDWNFYAFDSTLFITRDAYPDKYVRHDLEGSFLETVVSSTNANFLVPHFELLNGDSLQDYVKGFSLGQMSDLRLVGLDTVDRDNRKVSRLTFESAKGKACLADTDIDLVIVEHGGGNQVVAGPGSAQLPFGILGITVELPVQFRFAVFAFGIETAQPPVSTGEQHLRFAVEHTVRRRRPLSVKNVFAR